MAKQSAKDRAFRLSEGRCPIHGVSMPQIGLTGEGDQQRALVGCPRKDCEITGSAWDADGPVELMPEHAALLRPHPVGSIRQ
ncbi:hypothetical protein [Geopseudomonas aromaticivorans]